MLRESAGVQNNAYSSEAYALYEGGILEIKKRFSDHFTLFGNYTYSKAFDTSTDFNSDYGRRIQPTSIWTAVSPSLMSGTKW